MSPDDALWALGLIMDVAKVVTETLRDGGGRDEAAREAKAVVDRRRQIDADVDDAAR